MIEDWSETAHLNAFHHAIVSAVEACRTSDPSAIVDLLHGGLVEILFAWTVQVQTLSQPMCTLRSRQRV